MTLLQSIILGIVQGLTEFLPISSSAHLVLIPHLLGWQLDEQFVFPFSVLVQVGTLLAVIFYYRQDLKEIILSVFNGIKKGKPFEEEPARIGWLAVLATVPAGLIGFLFKDQVEAAFSSPSLTAVFLFLTAGLLILAEYAGKKTRELEELGWLDALWIGFFQVLSIFPGVSRSGSTISGGMTHGFKRQPAGQFAFLLAIPILAAAGLLGVLDLLQLENLSIYLPLMAAGFITSAVVGYFAIRWLISYISHNSLLPFAGYCLILGAGSLLLFGLPHFQPFSSSGSVLPASSKPASYKVSIEPDLEWILPLMNTCRQDSGNLNILFDQKAVSEPTGMTDDVFIAYGEVKGLSDSIFQIGSDSMVVAVHPSNPVETISPELAAGIFSGEISTWDQAQETCPDCFLSAPSQAEITPFIFPTETRLQDFAQEMLPPGSNFAGTDLIAPGARQLRESLASNDNAIGFLPGKWMDASVREVPWQDSQVQDISFPILAYTSNHFDENMAGWLRCVQNGIG